MRLQSLSRKTFELSGILLTAFLWDKTLTKFDFFPIAETQVILPLLKSDLYATLMECVNGELSLSLPQWHTDRFAVGVVAASGGYPGSVRKGCIIKGLKDLEVSFFSHVALCW